MRELKRQIPMGVRLTLLALMMLSLMGGTVRAGDEDFSAQARVGRTQITPEDTLTLQVVVRGGEARIDTQVIQDFQILSQGTSTQRSWVNGKSEHKVIYQYRLAPNKTGELTIPALTVSRDGEARYTEPIRVRVTQAPPVGQGSQKPVFAKAKASRDQVVVGEQFIYTFELYTARQIARANLDAPDFEGFTVQELKERANRTEFINGIEYAVTGIQYLVTPNGPGRLEIQPAVLGIEVVVPRRSNDPLDSFFNDSFFTGGSTRSLRLTSNPVEIQVSPLPAYAGAVPFSGLVGDFTLSAQLDKTELKAGESATLTYTLLGRGNIMDAVLPDPGLPEQTFKVYDDTPSQELQVSGEGLLGQKVFKRALVPLKAGTLQVPPVKLSYYNTRTRQYETLVSELFSLEVAPSAELQTQPDTPELPAPATDNKQTVALVNQDILDIRPQLTALESRGPLSVPLFLGLVFLPVLVYAGAVLTVARRSRHRDSLGRQMGSRAKEHLAQVGKSIKAGETDQALQQLRAGIMAALCGRADRSGESLTREEAREILETTQAESDQTRRVLETLDALDNARFGGGQMSPDQIRGHMDVLKGLIRTSLILLACLGMFWGGTAKVEAADGGRERQFIQAVDLYRAGEYAKAASIFEALAGSGIRNPDLFFNAGNAWLKAGETGKAVLWYERAKLLSPGDPDLRFNLEQALDKVTDKEELQTSLFTLVLEKLPPLIYLQYAVLGSCLIFFAHALVRRIRGRRVLTNAGGVLLALVIFAASAVALKYYDTLGMTRAVIIGDTVAVRSGTDDSSTHLFDLHAGTRVQVQSRQNGYLKILFTADKVGWVKIGEALEI